MRSIREALLERSYAQTDAAELAKVDPEIQYDPMQNTYLFLGETEVEGEVDPLAYGTPYEEEAEVVSKDAEGTQTLSGTETPKERDFPTIDPSATGKPTTSREDKRL